MSNNTSFGSGALSSLSSISGSDNAAFGYNALAKYTGSGETAVGSGTLANDIVTSSNTTNFNSAFGYQALTANTSGQQNTVMGYQAFLANITGSNNVALGDSTLAIYTNPHSSVVIGSQAGQNMVTTSGSNTTTTVDSLYPFILGYQTAQNAVQNTNNNINPTIMTVSDFMALGYQAAQNALQNTNNGDNETMSVSGFLALGYQTAQNALQNTNGIASTAMSVSGFLALGYQAAQNACSLTTNELISSLTANALTALGYQAAQNFNHGVVLEGNPNILNATVSANNVIAIGNQAAGNCNNFLGGIPSYIVNASDDELIAIGTHAAQNQNSSSNAATISAINNIAIGQMALLYNNYNNVNSNSSANFSADYNIAIGYQALMNNNNNISNTGTGVSSAVSSNNIAIGSNANANLGAPSNSNVNNTGVVPYGSDNIVIGNSSTIQTSIISNLQQQNHTAAECDRNIIIGNNSYFDSTYPSPSSSTEIINSTNDNIIIGNNLNIIGGKFVEEGLANQPGTFIANIYGNGSSFGTYTIGQINSVNGEGVLMSIVSIDQYNRLGSVTLASSSSSRRFKEEIRPLVMEDLAARFQRLQPVSFVYKSDPTRSRQYGLVAEDVLEVLPDCVEYETEPKTGQRQPYTVRYNGVTALLVKRVQEQEDEIQSLKRENTDLRMDFQALKKENFELKNRLFELEKKISRLLGDR